MQRGCWFTGAVVVLLNPPELIITNEDDNTVVHPLKELRLWSHICSLPSPHHGSSPSQGTTAQDASMARALERDWAGNGGQDSAPPIGTERSTQISTQTQYGGQLSSNRPKGSRAQTHRPTLRFPTMHLLISATPGLANRALLKITCLSQNMDWKGWLWPRLGNYFCKDMTWCRKDGAHDQCVESGLSRYGFRGTSYEAGLASV